VNIFQKKHFHNSEKLLHHSFKIVSFAVMSLFITSLNSGSNGNCYYVGNNTESILVDVGISCREVEKRMKRLGLLLEKVKAVFISHEHSDHIKGLPALIKKYQLPVYITSATFRNGGLTFESHLINVFKAHEPVIVGELSVTAFPKFHDAIDPYSFVVSHQKICVGVFTDIGVPCENLIKYFKQCHAAFLEANYDEEMLDKGGYPIYLKNRIRGGKGHLSNKQAFELFNKHRPDFMSHLLLAHLSKNNNSPEVVEKLFSENSGNVKITVASRYEETEVFQISETKGYSSFVVEPIKKTSPLQLSFSFA
jgi:phosphoribosyl 1,2-cyclic phosphodiesterase